MAIPATYWWILRYLWIWLCFLYMVSFGQAYRRLAPCKGPASMKLNHLSQPWWRTKLTSLLLSIRTAVWWGRCKTNHGNSKCSSIPSYLPSTWPLYNCQVPRPFYPLTCSTAIWKCSTPSDYIYLRGQFLVKEHFRWGLRKRNSHFFGFMANYERQAKVQYPDSTVREIITRNRNAHKV